VRQILIKVQGIETPVVFHGDVDLPVEERPHAGIIPVNSQALDLWCRPVILHKQAIHHFRPKL
jgi:hypothetical protein